MKRFIISLFIAAAGLCSCQKQDTPSTPTDPVTPMPTLSRVDVVLNIKAISKDVLDYFDITYNYTDFEGKTSQKAITKADTIAFSIANPQLDTTLKYPFTIELKVSDKSTPAKSSESYDATFKYELDLNGYLSDGSLMKSDYIQRSGSDKSYNFDSFKTVVPVYGKMLKKVYRICLGRNTITKEWQLNYVGDIQ